MSDIENYMDGWHDGANDRHYGTVTPPSIGGNYERGYRDGMKAYDEAKKKEAGE